jgi:hypothetical protein
MPVHHTYILILRSSWGALQSAKKPKFGLFWTRQPVKRACILPKEAEFARERRGYFLHIRLNW